MANYFTDEDAELRELINKCMEPICPEFKADHLINCLISKSHENMTPRQIFQSELQYVTDEDAELKALINECLEPIYPEFKAEYLINCLVLKCRQNMNPKQIFESEFRAQEEFEDFIDYNR